MKRMIAKLMLLLSLVFFVCTEVEAAKRNIKEWTFMIFMNGDNNLDQSAVKDLKEIRSKGSSNEFMNVVVMIDREKGPAITYYVEDGKLEILTKHGEVDMGDYKVYTDFVKSSIKNHYKPSDIPQVVKGSQPFLMYGRQHMLYQMEQVNF